MFVNNSRVNKKVLTIAAVGLMTAASSASAGCVASMTECASGATLGLLACSAAGASIGANPAFDTACVSTLAGAGGVCYNAFDTCLNDNTRPATLPVYSAGKRGVTTNLTAQTFSCNAGNNNTSDYMNRVNGIEIKRDVIAGSTLVSAIRMTCLSGNSYTFVGNTGIDGPSWLGGSCTAGYILQGLNLRVGAGVDAIGRICDKVGNSSGDTDNTTSGLSGGPGGTATSLKCTEGQYAKGLRVWYDFNRTVGERNVAGIELLCQPYL